MGLALQPIVQLANCAINPIAIPSANELGGGLLGWLVGWLEFEAGWLDLSGSAVFRMQIGRREAGGVSARSTKTTTALQLARRVARTWAARWRQRAAAQPAEWKGWPSGGL